MSTAFQPDAQVSIPSAPVFRDQPRVDAAEGVLAAARKLVPLIREHAPEAEANRRLARAVLDAMEAAGLFRMLLPRSLGGLEIDPVTFAHVAEELARADTAAAWLLQVNTGSWFSARLSKEGAEELYKDNRNARMSAAFHPPQAAIEVEGGLRITGRAPLASNIHDADWLFLSALVMDGDHPKLTNGMPDVRALILHAKEANIIDTWDSLGMRATDSHDVAVDNVFVPLSRSFPFLPQFEPNEHFRGPLYQLPAVTSTVTIIAPVGLAIAREAITELRNMAAARTPLGFTKPMRERAVVQATLAKAEGLLRAARLLFYDTVATTWTRTLAGEGSTLEQKADLLLASSHAVATAATVTDMMHRLAGTVGVYKRNRLERLFRDVTTVRAHGFASDNRFEAAGQVYLGLPPEFFLVAF